MASSLHKASTKQVFQIFKRPNAMETPAAASPMLEGTSQEDAHPACRELAKLLNPPLRLTLKYQWRVVLFQINLMERKQFREFQGKNAAELAAATIYIIVKHGSGEMYTDQPKQ